MSDERSEAAQGAPNDSAEAVAASLKGLKIEAAGEAADLQEVTQPPGAPPASDDVKRAAQSKANEIASAELVGAMLAARKPSSGVHKFWDTQPVPKLPDDGDSKKARKEADDIPVGPLDDTKTVDDVRKDPYNLPKGFEWCTLDVADDAQLKEVYTLLTENYVEDDDGMFRFDYSPEFLRWALMPPGYFKNWIVGVRQSNNQALRAMITGIPALTHVLDKSVKTAEINFLCVHQKLRHKRLAPVLIKEVTRRVNLENQWQAIYTAGIKIPTPIGVAQYFHRSLNPQKLIKVGFSRLHPRMTMAATKRLYRVNAAPKHNFKVMEQRHVPSAAALLKGYLSKHKVWIELDEHEVSHWLLTRKDVVYSYVIEDLDNPDKVTDMISFYNLPSTILGHPDYNHLKAAYSYYNVATTAPLKDLMEDALVFAKENDFDVFNALDLMDNKSFLKDLKFGEGDGRLHYYLYNYGIPEMPSEDIGVVLL